MIRIIVHVHSATDSKDCGRIVDHPEAIFTSGKGTTDYPPKVAQRLRIALGKRRYRNVARITTTDHFRSWAIDGDCECGCPTSQDWRSLSVNM